MGINNKVLLDSKLSSVLPFKRVVEDFPLVVSSFKMNMEAMLSCPGCGDSDEYVLGSCSECGYIDVGVVESHRVHQILNNLERRKRGAPSKAEQLMQFEKDFSLAVEYGIIDPEKGVGKQQKEIEVMVEKVTEQEGEIHTLIIFKHLCRIKDNTSNDSKVRQRYLGDGERISRTYLCVRDTNNGIMLYSGKTKRSRPIEDKEGFVSIKNGVRISLTHLVEGLDNFYAQLLDEVA